MQHLGFHAILKLPFVQFYIFNIITTEKSISAIWKCNFSSNIGFLCNLKLPFLSFRNYIFIFLNKHRRKINFSDLKMQLFVKHWVFMQFEITIRWILPFLSFRNYIFIFLNKNIATIQFQRIENATLTFLWRLTFVTVSILSIISIRLQCWDHLYFNIIIMRHCNMHNAGWLAKNLSPLT